MVFSVLHLFLVLIALLALNELFRRFKWATLFAFVALPIVLIPVWFNSEIDHWFRWVKLYSVVFAVIWFTLFRFTKLGEKNFAKFIAAAFLAVNIAEAVTQDFSMLRIPNALNAVAGILSIITLSGWKGIIPDRNCKEQDMVWPEMTLFWIIAYDIWNWTFVYLNFPEHASYHIMVLLACTIPAFFKRSLWLQARAFTLGAWMMYLFTFQPFIDNHIVWLPDHSIFLWLAASLSLGANGLYAILHFRRKFAQKKRIQQATA